MRVWVLISTFCGHSRIRGVYRTADEAKNEIAEGDWLAAPGKRWKCEDTTRRYVDRWTVEPHSLKGAKT